MSLLRHRQFPFTGVVPHQGNRRYVMPNKPGGGGPGPGIITLIQDTFTDANSTLITAHTPDINTPGNSWTSFDTSGGVAVAEIQANELTSDGVNNCIALIDAGQADVVMQMKVTQTGGAAGVQTMFRAAAVSGWDNYWMVNATTGLTGFDLRNRVAGVNATIDSAAGLVVPLTFTVQITLKGNQIDAEIVGLAGSAVSANSAQFATETRFGARMVTANSDTRDDLVITDNA